MKTKLDNMFNDNFQQLRSFSKARLFQNRSGHYDASELLNECYIFCLNQVSPNKTEIDYIKIAKNYINNQTSWQPGNAQPKENSKNFKLKHQITGFDNTRVEFDQIDEEDYDSRIDFALWVEQFLDRPEKNLFKLYFIEDLSHRKIAQQIRDSGIKICDTSVYNEIIKLKSKLKKYSQLWNQQ